ncbi:DUF2306 domain-containing protein [Pseudonocardia sp. C8]|uniref:DUF2306 domain-containing protein n=1 Tax=Pseudonocardia sp. C8 TaxID=2762759 RepID=UPI001C92D955
MTRSRRPEADRWRRPPVTVDRARGHRNRPTPAGAIRLWLLSATLALFALLPVLARLLVELAADPAVDARSVASVPLIVHAASGTLFTALGAFQFPTASRRRGRGSGWHPRIGRVLVPLGLTAALSALWLTLFHSHADGTEQLLYVLRLIFGVVMVASIFAGFIAIRRHDVDRHRAWMIRAYAIGLGASTQIFTLGFGGAAFGTGEPSAALLTGAGWLINLVVAEWVIRRSMVGRSLPGGG